MLNRNLIPFLPDDVKNIHAGHLQVFNDIFLKNPLSLMSSIDKMRKKNYK